MSDRPIDCSECKRPIAVCYTEIVDGAITRTSMCALCPHLEEHLHGIRTDQPSEASLGKDAGLCCGNCGTTLDAVRKGTALGCPECYEVFGEVLLAELLAANKISQRFIPSSRKAVPLHIGRSPGEKTEVTPALRLLALNEALNETLSREDYEQAAWLRDQIKALTEKPSEGKQ